MTLLFTFYHSNNKENDGAAYQSCRRRSTINNPYSQPLPFNQNERNARRNSVKTVTTIKLTNPSTTARPSTANAVTTNHGSHASSLDTIEEEETSPTIRRILEKTGCSSRQEFLAMKAQQARKQVNANGSKSTTVLKTAPNRPKSAGKVSNAKTATTKSTSTNPKKKAKSKQFAWHSWPLQNNDCIHSHSHSLTHLMTL